MARSDSVNHLRVAAERQGVVQEPCWCSSIKAVVKSALSTILEPICYHRLAADVPEGPVGRALCAHCRCLTLAFPPPLQRIRAAQRHASACMYAKRASCGDAKEAASDAVPGGGR